MGSAIARRLSFTTARVALVEAADDVGEGASKGNTGIATCGADCPPGSLEAELVTRSSPGWEALCATLDTPFRRIGRLAVARTAEEERGLERLLESARANGCDAEVVTGDAGSRASSRMLAPSARAALHVPATGSSIRSGSRSATPSWPPETASTVLLGSPVTGLRTSGERITHVETPREVLGAGFVVNAAGIEADTISRLAGGEPFSTWPRQGQYWLLDREVGSRFQAIVGGVPTAASRGVYCVPTTHGSLLLGPTARDGDDRRDRAVDAESLDAIFAAARRLVPELDREVGDQDVRRQPAGVRARLPDRRRSQPPEPCARRRHPLDRRVVLARARRARPRGPGRGRGAGARRAPWGGERPRARATASRPPRPGRPLRPRRRVWRGRLPVRAGDGRRDHHGVSHAPWRRAPSPACVSARTRPPAAARARRASPSSLGGSRLVPDTIAIVGAGASGLACAQALAGRARTVVVERRSELEADVRATAIRWDGRALLAMGPCGPLEVAAAALVVATGARPLGAGRARPRRHAGRLAWSRRRPPASWPSRDFSCRPGRW